MAISIIWTSLSIGDDDSGDNDISILFNKYNNNSSNYNIITLFTL